MVPLVETLLFQYPELGPRRWLKQQKKHSQLLELLAAQITPRAVTYVKQGCYVFCQNAIFQNAYFPNSFFSIVLHKVYFTRKLFSEINFQKPKFFRNPTFYIFPKSLKSYWIDYRKMANSLLHICKTTDKKAVEKSSEKT